MRRAQIDMASQVVRNLATNPSFETANGTVTTHTNIAQNPSFEGTSGTVDVRTNLFTNPAFDATSGLTDVRTNWIANPSFGATSGTTNVRTNHCTNPALETLNGTLTVRTNLAVNPRMTDTNLGGYGTGTQTLTALSTGVTANPELITTAVRASYTAGATNPGTLLMILPDVSSTYTISAWVYNEGPTAEAVALALRGVSSGGQQTVSPGIWTRLSWTMTTPASLTATNDFGVRIAVPTSTGSFLTTGVLIEKSNTLNPYFDATAPAYQNLAKTATTALTGVTITTGVPYSGMIWSRAAVASGSSGWIARQYVALSDIVNGETYTASVTVANDQAVAQSISIDWSDTTIASFTIQPGEVRRIKVTGVRSTYDNVFRFADLQVNQDPSGPRSILFKDWNVEHGTTNGEYYSGNGDYTYAWSGTANASTSIMSAPRLAGMSVENGGALYRDSFSQMSGTYSGKMLPSSGDFYITAASTTVSEGWTFSLDYKTSGTLTGNPRLFISGGGTPVTLSLPLTQTTAGRFSVTLPATSAGVTQVVGAVFAATTGEFWVDNILLERTPVAQPYFDGASTASGDFTYAWAGTANASLSYQQAPIISNWLNRWYGSTGGAGVLYQAKGGISGTYARKLWTQTNTGSSMDTGLNTANTTAWANTTYTLSAWVRCSVDQVFQFYIDWKDSGGTLLTSSRPTQTATIPANTWTRIAITATSPANTAMASFVIGAYNGATAMPAGSTMDFDDVLAEVYPSVREYFDGSTPIKNYCINPSFDTDTSGWTAAAMVPGHGRSSTRSWTGSHSLWGVATDTAGDSMYAATTAYDVDAGATYTMSAYAYVPAGVIATDFRGGNRNLWAVASNNAVPTLVGTANLDFSKTNQWQRISVSIVIPAGSNKLNIRLYFPANSLGIYWDAILIEKSSTMNPYYAGQGGFTYAWTGAVNTSASVQQAPRPAHSSAANQAVTYQVGTTGKYKNRISFNGTTIGDSGINFSTGVTTGASKTYTVSVDFLADSNRTVKFSAQGTGVVAQNSANIPLTAGVITRQIWSFTTAASGTYALYILRGDSLLGNIDLDHLLIEEGTIQNGGYFDGSKTDQNLVSNPNFEVNTTGWVSDTGAPTLTSSTDRAYLGTKSLKAVSTVTGSDVAVAFSYSNLKPSTSYTVSYYVYSMDARTSCYIDVAATNLNRTRLGEVAISAGTWNRISATFITPENVVGSTSFYLHHSGGPNVSGAVVYIDAVLLEESEKLNQYYEGTGDFTYAWTGTANASTSVQRGTAVNRVASERAYGISTTRNGDKIVRVIPSGKGNGGGYTAYTGTDVFMTLNSQVPSLKPNTTYTLYALLENEAALSAGAKFRFNIDGSDQYSPALQTTVGEYSTYWQFTTGANGTINFMRFMPGPSGVAGITNEVLLKKILIVEGPYTGPYFDGATVATTDFSYFWTGTANDSTSYRRGTGVSGYTTGNSLAVQSSEWSASGSKSIRITPTTQYNTTSALFNGLTLEKGKPYTLLATRYLPAPLTGTLSTYAGALFSVQTGVGTFLSPQLPNVAGVAQARLHFTLDPSVTTWTLRLGHGGAEGSGDVWWDNVMLVEGTYTGDYVDGTKPFSKWTGTANSSVSVGYPPQFFDIAGKPAAELVGVTGDTGNILAPSPFSARTVYFVYEHTDNNAAWQAPLYYARPAGGGAEGMVMQTSDVGSPYLYPRADFIGGSQNATTVVPNGRKNGRHVLAMSFPQGLVSSSTTLDGGADIQRLYADPAGGWASGRLYALARTGIAHVHSIVFYEEHSRETRLAISRYLGNKYGASVS